MFLASTTWLEPSLNFGTIITYIGNPYENYYILKRP